MTSFKQFEANRRNAHKSTGPTTEEGKQRSRCNAVRHGLTAESVIGALEDAEDYKAFEAAIIADYDAQSAVERELVLRLASVLWRLRRASTIETGLFEIQAEHPGGNRRPLLHAAPQRSDLAIQDTPSHDAPCIMETEPDIAKKADGPALELTRCFLRLANLPNFALDRLSRYEANLWRQACRILYALETLDRRKPQERTRPWWHFRKETHVEGE